MVEIKRKGGESFETFLRRFSKRLLQSQKLKEVRSKQRRQPKINKNKQKLRAIVGMGLFKKREYLKKIGKYKEEPRRKW